MLASGCAPGKFSDFVREEQADVGRDAAIAGDARVPLDAQAMDARVAIDAARSVDDSAVDARVQPPADAGASDAGTSCVPSLTGALSVSTPAVELARMARSPVFGIRSLGPLVRLGEADHVWTFSSAQRLGAAPVPAGTPSNFPFVAFDGPVQPWNQPVTKPWTLKSATVADGLPTTVLPLAQGETNVVSLVPTSLTRAGNETRSELYLQQYDYLAPTKMWRAMLEDGSEVAVRAAQPLFTAPPFFGVAARIDGEWMYVYACSNDTDASRCYAGRVPYAKRDDASAYQVRTLSADNVWGWTNNLQAGTPVLENVNQADLTVSYNNYLHSFIAVYGEVLSNDVTLRTSASPYGPWSEPVHVALPVPAAWANMSIREQPQLAQNCERRLIITYFAPTAANQFPTDGDVVMAAIDLD
ncbi:MAG TPA: DUF4185 domain-containing protein [Polyangiales bacterium]|nr:DUF4185 domain-containing protein [Polyangiales bacterium]